MGFQSRASTERQEEITMKISIKITALLVALNISLTMSSPRDPRGFAFTFTWVPDDNAVSPRDFPEFFKTFMKNAEKASNKKYFMAFDNIIHREVDGALYEAADWIVEGFGRGTYFNTAKNGRVTWDMATQSQLGQD